MNGNATGVMMIVLEKDEEYRDSSYTSALDE